MSYWPFIQALGLAGFTGLAIWVVLMAVHDVIDRRFPW